MARQSPRARRLGPLPSSLLLHAFLLALLLVSFQRRKPPPPLFPQEGIAVVFQSTGITKAAPHNAAPKAHRTAPPMLAQVPKQALPPPPPPEPKSEQAEVRLNIPSFLPYRAPQAASPPPPPRQAHTRPVRKTPPFIAMGPMSYHGEQNRAPQMNPGHPGLNLQVAQSDLSDTAPSIVFKGSAGADWENAFSNWVHRHAYYPQAAADNDESGSVTVRIVVTPDGHVRSAELLKSSGAPLLNMAWYGLLQHADLPPFPRGSPAKTETVTATMHFILIH